MNGKIKFRALLLAAGIGSRLMPLTKNKPKCLMEINGIPLLEYSVYSALEAKKNKILSDVILSTDSERYLELLDKYNIYKDYLRPREFAQDKSPTIDVIIDALNWLKKNYSKTFDAVMLLQPTSPFRTPIHMQNAISLLKFTHDNNYINAKK